MGFIDKLKEGVKRAADRVTGGYGKIELSLDKATYTPGEQISAQVTVLATGELKAKRVLLKLTGTEEISFEYPCEEKDASGSVRTGTKRETKTEATLQNEFEIHGELVMKEGESKNISYAIQVPPECRPTYMGVHCTHKWKVDAEIDVPWGADVRTGQEITMR